MLGHACNNQLGPVVPALERIGVQGYPRLHKEFQANLGYNVTLYLKEERVVLAPKVVVHVRIRENETG